MTLLLLPNLLGEHRHHEIFLPASVDRAVATLDGLIAENEREGRRYLSRFPTKKPASEIPIALFPKHMNDAESDFLLEPVIKGERWGVVSDGGLPCIADPGSHLVLRARKRGVPVQAFVGPSSITLALMLSGLPGQNFSFHGYLEKETALLKESLLRLEKDPTTHIFMERPYRNKQTLDALLEVLSDKTWLSIAWELTMPEQGVMTQEVGVWKKSPLPNLDKRNALFLFKNDMKK